MIMHPIKSIVLTTAILSGLAGMTGVKAQNASYPAGDLSLKQCLQYALQHNYDLALRRMDEKTGLEKVKETRAQALPQINATGLLQDNVQKQVLVLPPDIANLFPGSNGKPIPISLTWQLTAQATLAQQLFNEQVFTALRAAKASTEYYSMNTALTETQVIEQVSSLYYRYQVTVTQVGVLDSNITNIAKVKESTQAQFENGLARRMDVDRLQVNLTNLLTQRRSLMDSIVTQGFQLRYMMGLPMDQGLDLQAFQPKAIEDQIGVGVSLDSGLDLNNRLEYTILNKEVELEGFQKKANKAEFYPSLSFNANYSTNGVSDNFDFIGHGTTAIWYQVGYISLNLNIPIFDGGARRSRVHQAQIQIDEYRKQAEQTASELDMDYRNAKLNLATSITNIHAQKDNVDLAYEVYQTTQSNYKVGLSTLTDLLDSENSFLTAQHNYYVSLLQYKLAEIGLIKANGNLKSLLN
jgi:outer membrane protein